ncbi:MAG: hypothetical protein K2W96_16620 [Gemmataceae bacterium]|nr:hypothetical protein [Gemmataceae bacterium]
MIHGLTDEPDPSWASVLAALDSLPSLEADIDINLQADDDVWMIVYYVKDYGFLVTCCPQGATEYYTLVDSSQGKECVRVWCAGEFMERLRLVFVDRERAVKALKCFFETSLCEPTLEWELDDACWCRGTFSP